MSTTISKTENLVEMLVGIVERMPVDSVLTQHAVSWEEYEELIEAVGDASGLRISYDSGRLQIMTLSQRHERYSTLIGRIVGQLSLLLRIKVLFYGSVTIKKQRKQKGVEPDACFYVQNATLVGTKDEIDFNVDPPPDVVVEVDLHHESLSKFPIYADLGVPEIWRYDGKALTMHHLRDGEYVASEASLSLPVLTSGVLTEFLARSPKQDQYDILLAFEEWLKTQQQ
jgi:Uma2 family endonuclease